jgi:Tol biopolymer transport system component
VYIRQNSVIFWESLTFRQLLLLAIFFLALVACNNNVAQIATREPSKIELTVDGQTNRLTTEAHNVRELLEEAEVDIGDADIVEPPLFTLIADDLEVSVVRVSESIDILEQSIPFQRKIVRNESMSADDPPLIIQGGNPGLQEITVRIVYHDGLEFTRQETLSTLIEPTQDEIVMIGVGTGPGTVEFNGILGFISGGNSIILRGSSFLPEQINTGSDLDHRVFSLSPNGSQLLYTRASDEVESFNSLWLVDIEPGSRPRSLEIDNVLWADWNPDRVGQPQIALTTGVATDLLPGWEANNDLWIGDIPNSRNESFDPEQLVESYPATYGWWGGNYAWSPNGRFIAYSYADEIGVIDTDSDDEEGFRILLHSFTEYNTRADWVWIPSITWAPDDSALLFTRHSDDDPTTAVFETWAVMIEDATAARFVEGSGMWSHPKWSSNITNEFDESQSMSQIAYLKATNPLESQQSSYTLWLMDRDGSNAFQLYPPAGENSRFPREQEFLVWGPGGKNIAFVYDSSLLMLNIESREVRRITQDDNIVSNPTWAPYGRATVRDLPSFDTESEDDLRSPRGEDISPRDTEPDDDLRPPRGEDFSPRDTEPDDDLRPPRGEDRPTG